MLTGWKEIATPLAVVAISSLSGLLGYRLKSRKDAAETLAVSGTSAESFFRQLGELRAQFVGIEDRCTTLERENFRLREENAQLADVIPVMSLIAQVMDFDRARKVFDEATDGWVVSAADGDGGFRWVNMAFASALNLTREEVITTNWRALVLPEFLEPTERVEEAAVARPVIHFRNAYRRKGGGTVWLSWFCCPYKDGATLSVVRMRVEL